MHVCEGERQRDEHIDNIFMPQPVCDREKERMISFRVRTNEDNNPNIRVSDRKSGRQREREREREREEIFLTSFAAAIWRPYFGTSGCLARQYMNMLRVVEERKRGFPGKLPQDTM